MNYSFDAASIDLGIDDTEEVYSIVFNQPSPDGGPPLNSLLMQRSVEGIEDNEPEFVEPYVEFNDPSNGRFAPSFISADLTESSFTLTMKRSAGIVTHPGIDAPSDSIEALTVNFSVNAAKLRKLRLALELVIVDGFPFKSNIAV